MSDSFVPGGSSSFWALFGFASATGFLDIKITSSSLELAAGLKFTIGPLSFDVNGSLGIFSDGLTATLNVSLDVSLLSLFELKMSGSLQLDTRTSHTKFFRLALSGKLSVLGGVISMSGGIVIVVSGGTWSITVPESNKLSAVFGPLSISAWGSIHSSGTFDLHFSGGICLPDCTSAQPMESWIA